MVEGEKPVYSDPGNETRMTLFDGVQPGAEERRAEMRKLIEKVLERKPLSIVIYAECEEGIVAGAIGSPIGVIALMNQGKLQVLDMISRGAASGENG